MIFILEILTISGQSFAWNSRRASVQRPGISQGVNWPLMIRISGISTPEAFRMRAKAARSAGPEDEKNPGRQPAENPPDYLGSNIVFQHTSKESSGSICRQLTRLFKFYIMHF